MSELVLQKSVPYPALTARALPSLQVLDPADWLLYDEVEAEQCALREALLASDRDAVLARMAGSEAAEAEALEMIGAHLRDIHGRALRLFQLEDLAGTIQEDVVILQPGPQGHVMVAALLCFPASWMLSEKIGRAMAQIHDPVEEISPRMDRQIERIFVGLRPDRPLWRWNQLWYHAPDLFQPRSVHDKRPRPDGDGDYLRTERQCLLRMPRTGAVMFTIHTFVVARADVTARAAHFGKLT
ncbi:MAG: DUF3445 domain-containing protein [Pseudomonadota bacterium]